MKEYPIVDTVDTLKALLASVRKAQEEFAKFPQEKVDAIFRAAAIAANQARIPLAKMAVEETGMGVVEDRSSRIILHPNISTMPIKTPRPAA